MIPNRTDPRWLALTTLGLGHLRPAPGSWGSLPPVAIAGGMILLGLGPAEAPILYHTVLIAILLAASGACVVFGEWGEAWYGKKDPGWIVADETAGQCIPLIALPLAAGSGMCTVAAALAVAFLSFRAFDILKPPPAFALQKLPGGWGVLVDDLAAGFYALVATQLVCLLLL